MSSADSAGADTVITAEGRSRVVVEGLAPRVDCGEFPIKRIVGDAVDAEVTAYGDGHDAVACVLRYRREGDAGWSEVAMSPADSDRWRGSFGVTEVGRYRYSVVAWVDRFATWSQDLVKRLAAGNDVAVDLEIGARLVDEAAARATGPDAARLAAVGALLHRGGTEGASVAVAPEIGLLMTEHAGRPHATEGEELVVVVDRERARFGAWYEIFPRSASTEAGRHGTFRDVEARLPELAAMGFDVLYLPPIHPIGRSFRKGRNNSTQAGPDDPGSPWAIGSAEGGHKSVHPDLGTLQDFRHLVDAAAALGLEVALDIAFQCSPDHPYATEHPEWFRARPDGTIQYAENPPKKYQDIYPFDFETPAWRELWNELRSIVEFWIAQGVRIFRIDNPHTKPFVFWAWLIDGVKSEHPDVIFLAEAFTRPNVMYRLAKLGFTQSYNYFPWRNSKAELTEFMTGLTRSEVREYFGANLWPNTPDILPEYLQFGGRPAFAARLVLAATLGTSYGVYGPVYEHAVNEPLAPGREEYLDSEKYQVRPWQPDRADTLAELMTRLNRIRREQPAFRASVDLRFLHVDNDQLIAYCKSTPDLASQVLVVVNLDPHHVQSGFVDVPLEDLGIDPSQPYQAHDLLTDRRYLWYGSRNYVELHPDQHQANVFVLRRRVRTEHDFDYYL